MTFRVGQKVVCVSDGFGFIQGEITPHRGDVGSVRDIRASNNYPGEFVIRLVEIRNEPRGYDGGVFVECWFRAVRFRPIVERKTDISVFTEILRKATKPVRVPSVAITQHHFGSENG